MAYIIDGKPIQLERKKTAICSLCKGERKMTFAGKTVDCPRCCGRKAASIQTK